jgi:O-acetyl-ADP-ribose deacetylase (regulator of RNase III)
MDIDQWPCNPWEEPPLERTDARVTEPSGPIVRWQGCEVALHRGDISELAVDAIVCAANFWLQPGGGVSGAILLRAGEALNEEGIRLTRAHGKLAVSEAVLTGRAALSSRHVIHVVGPTYRDDPERAPELLARAYRNGLRLPRQHARRTIAFPCISTGSYGFPRPDACQIAVATVREELDAGEFDRIVFCVSDPRDAELYSDAIKT